MLGQSSVQDRVVTLDLAHVAVSRVGHLLRRRERLAELERELQSSLVHRTTRKLTLTEDGSAFYERACKIARDVTDATAELAERRGALVGPLRIAAPVSFGMRHLGPALNEFLVAHPGVDITLDLDDRFVDRASDGYDLAIRVGQPADSRLTIWL